MARAYLLTTLVRAFLKPSSCMPPSMVEMPLAKEWMLSWKPVFHWRAISTSMVSSVCSNEQTLRKSASLEALRCLT